MMYLVTFSTDFNETNNEELSANETVQTTENELTRPEQMKSLFDDYAFTNNDGETMNALLESIQLDQTSKYLELFSTRSSNLNILYIIIIVTA